MGPGEQGIVYLFREKLPGRRAKVQDILDACEKVNKPLIEEQKTEEDENFENKSFT